MTASPSRVASALQEPARPSSPGAMERAAAAAESLPATGGGSGAPADQGAAESGAAVPASGDRVLHAQSSSLEAPAADDANLAARDLSSVVAGLSGGQRRERDSLPTDDRPSPPGAKRHKATTATANEDDADSPALTLAKLRGQAAAQDELQSAEEGARVEKWFFNRWYTGTVLGSDGPPIRAKGRAMVRFEGASSSLL